MGRYSKGVEGVDHYYQPDDLYKYAGEPFDVRVSILDEPPGDALWVAVPEDNISRSIGEILDELVIGADAKQTEFIRENLLELDESPWLSDALDWVSDIWHRFREGDADLTLCVNNGPDNISLQDTPREHMSTCVWRDGSYDYMLLDLVFEPGDMTLLGMLGERKQDFLLWMKGFVALYKLDTDSSAERVLRKRDDLEEAREQLFHHNLVSKGARGKLEITQQGRRAIGRLLEEQDELIANFDVYRDVVLRTPKSGGMVAEFGTLSGADYRVAVYRHQDIDPFRAIFVLTLLSGELDDELKGKEWVEKINDERFYEGLLSPAVDHSQLSEEELEELIAQGGQYLARTAALRQRATYSQGVLQRAKTIQAFPKPPSKKKEDQEGGPTKGFRRASEADEAALEGEAPAGAIKKLPEGETPKALPPKKPPSLFPPPPQSEFPPPPAAGPGRQGPRPRFRGGPAPSAPAQPRPGVKPRRDDDDGWL